MARYVFFMHLITVPLLAIFLTYVYTFHLRRTIHVLGVFRKPDKTFVLPSDIVVIEGTTHCEDLHYYQPRNLIFTACEASVDTRLSWFPPISHLDDPSALSLDGKLQVVDPKTLKTWDLALEGLDGPFVTHGIDVISDPDSPESQAVYIFAINHKPQSKHYHENGDPKAHSVVEIFHHILGSNSARHIRSVWHPLITTPNDLIALSSNSFFVTNDHHYKTGFMRDIEDVFFGARWTNVIHVELSAPISSPNETQGVEASVALNKMHNNNGICYGRTKKDVFITSCSSGLLHISEIRDNGAGSPIIEVKEVVKFETPLDNPFYFSDPYANETFDASGVVVCGPTRGIDFASNKQKHEVLDPIMVWKASPIHRGSNKDDKKWEPRIIFQDDGHRIRTASSALLVAIDPEEESGKRRAWLFVSGYMSTNAIAVKIDL